MLKQILFILLIPGFCFSAACPETVPQGEFAACNQITQYGITWTFSEDKTVGQFITGDYWVIGPVTVSSVTPEPVGTGTALRNGSMVNPFNRGKVSHDGRIPGFDFAYNVSFPLSLNTGESLVSVESHTTDVSHPTALGENAAPEHAPLKNASVLTVLATQPPANSFRPAISDPNKTLYGWNDIRFDKIPYVAKPEGTMVHTVEQYKRAFQRPWLLYHTSYYNRYLGPTENQGNYHEYISTALHELGSLLMTDVEDHSELLKGYLQAGIDMYYAISTATAGQNRKLNRSLIVITSALFDKPEMAQWSPSSFRENYQPYYGTGWYGQTVLWSQGSTQHYEEAQPENWDTVALSSNCGCKNEQYRRDTFVRLWTGGYVSAKLLGAESLWGSTAFFDLIERWFDEAGPEDEARVLDLIDICSAPQDNGCASMNVFPASGSTVSVFSKQMYDTYGSFEVETPALQGLRKGAFRLPGSVGPVNFVETVE
jgi:hypothetical protein